MPVELRIDPAPAGARSASSADDLDDLVETLRDDLAGGPVHLVLGPPLPDHLSVPEVFRRLVEDLDDAGVLVVHVSAGAHDLCARYTRAPTRQPVVRTLGGRQVGLLLCDLLSVRAEALVNASNTRLKLGGGVSGSVAQACGPGLQAELSRIERRGELAHGDVVVTSAPGLPHARWVLHAATAAGTAHVVRRGLEQVLAVCEARGIESVAVPALGTGVGGLPVATCASLYAEILGRPVVAPRCARVTVAVLSVSAFDEFATVFHSVSPKDTSRGTA